MEILTKSKLLRKFKKAISVLETIESKSKRFIYG